MLVFKEYRCDWHFRQSINDSLLSPATRLAKLSQVVLLFGLPVC